MAAAHWQALNLVYAKRSQDLCSSLELLRVLIDKHGLNSSKTAKPTQNRASGSKTLASKQAAQSSGDTAAFVTHR